MVVLVEIDGPELNLSFVPTSAAEVNHIRAYGVQMCQDNNVPEVSFEYVTANQFRKHFRVTAEGFVETDFDMGLDLEYKEVRRIHHA